MRPSCDPATDQLAGPVLDALDALDAPVGVFLRDDDAGWDDERLFALLAVTADQGVPIDLAVIPAAIGDGLARILCDRHDAGGALLGLHQHGHAHLNHESSGRSCEFGPGRAPDRQRDDLAAGRRRLAELFGDRLLPVFTPPWNRCAAGTPALLAALGFRALSRDRRATPQVDLPELPIDVDWSRHHRENGLPGIAAALVDAIAARSRDAQPLGLMLHHAVMDDDERAALGGALRRWTAHPNWQAYGMALLLKPNPSARPKAPPAAPTFPT